MAATISTVAMLNAKCLSINTTPKTTTTASKPTSPKPISLLSTANLPKGLITPEPSNCSSAPTSLAGTALAGAFFSALNSCEPAMAAQQIAEIAEGDNRGLALLLPIIPALAWVLYNILQPALNQINRMRSEKAVIIGLGLGGLAASGFFSSTPHAMASEIAVVADAAGDNRGQLLLFVILPAIAWVLYNILQPALNQINRMRSQ
ncbi:hypothetical protein Nepgr_027931 [Nepenthes gracilis]|uniref:Uncharacterized protein n=1 Tax=Nepenthes gracilis TaxID=150966 RepID=A0AAD3T9Q4_NEPGR|nr:hypothetical protein Nepgr_027931 [Nepenthes gracilis]